MFSNQPNQGANNSDGILSRVTFQLNRHLTLSAPLVDSLSKWIEGRVFSVDRSGNLAMSHHGRQDMGVGEDDGLMIHMCAVFQDRSHYAYDLKFRFYDSSDQNRVFVVDNVSFALDLKDCPFPSSIKESRVVGATDIIFQGLLPDKIYQMVVPPDGILGKPANLPIPPGILSDSVELQLPTRELTGRVG